MIPPNSRPYYGKPMVNPLRRPAISWGPHMALGGWAPNRFPWPNKRRRSLGIKFKNAQNWFKMKTFRSGINRKNIPDYGHHHDPLIINPLSVRPYFFGGFLGLALGGGTLRFPMKRTAGKKKGNKLFEDLNECSKKENCFRCSPICSLFVRLALECKQTKKHPA